MEFLWAFDDSIYFDIVFSFPQFLIWPNIIAGSNLVDIQSKSENSFISNFTSSDLWTGGALISESDSWQWEGGAPWSWTGWDDELPVDVVEGCLSIQPGQHVHDIEAFKTQKGDLTVCPRSFYDTEQYLSCQTQPNSKCVSKLKVYFQEVSGPPWTATRCTARCVRSRGRRGTAWTLWQAGQGRLLADTACT